MAANRKLTPEQEEGVVKMYLNPNTTIHMIQWTYETSPRTIREIAIKHNLPLRPKYRKATAIKNFRKYESID